MEVNFDTIQGGDLPGTVARVNRVLRKLGVEERIVQGRGYVYFAEGDAYSWYSSSIPIHHISQMTVRQLIEEYVRLKNEGDESSKDRQAIRDDGRYRIRRSQSSTSSASIMNTNPKLLQAAKQRIRSQVRQLPTTAAVPKEGREQLKARIQDLESGEDVLNSLLKFIDPDLNFRVFPRLHSPVAFWEWDDLDVEEGEVYKLLEDLGGTRHVASNEISYTIGHFSVIFSENLALCCVVEL